VQYDYIAIPPGEVLQAANPLFGSLLDTYTSETDKMISVWRCFCGPYPVSWAKAAGRK
jgi:hypothetical protein